MLHGVEKLRQVGVNRHAISLADEVAHLVHGIVGREAHAETETRFRETRIEDRKQYLGNGLLDQAVKHGRNPKGA
jgi:hypothetical protein